MNKATWLTKQMIARAISILEMVKDMSFSQSEKSACDEGIARLKNSEPEYLCNLLPDEPHDSFKARCILIENMLDKNPAAVSLGRLGGLKTSPLKSQKSAENGKLGGRPPKDKSAI